MPPDAGLSLLLILIINLGKLLGKYIIVTHTNSTWNTTALPLIHLPSMLSLERTSIRHRDSTSIVNH